MGWALLVLLHFDLHPQVTSGRQASEIGGSLVQTDDYILVSFVKANVSVGGGTMIC